MNLKALALGVALLGATATGSYAAVDYESDLATWQSVVGPNFQTTTYGTDGSTISSFVLNDGSAAGLTLDMSPDGQILHVPSTWATWCCGYTGQVLYNGGNTFTFDLTPGERTTGIGFYAEPEAFSTFEITLMAASGAVLAQDVFGDAGAKFFGFSAPAGEVASFLVSSTQPFAVGDFYAERAVPEPSTWAMMIVGFAGLGFAAFWRARKTSAAIV
jgi:PEP-CTERM motif